MVLSIHHPRYQSLRAHMKHLRKSAKLTQIHLADAMGLEQSYVSKIERGERYVDVLFYIDWCKACGTLPHEALKQLE
jgi:transcriptional regulator with XRE-family HTH domain